MSRVFRCVEGERLCVSGADDSMVPGPEMPQPQDAITAQAFYANVAMSHETAKCPLSCPDPNETLRAIACKVCGNKFDRPSELLTHIIVKHIQSEKNSSDLNETVNDVRGLELSSDTIADATLRNNSAFDLITPVKQRPTGSPLPPCSDSEEQPPVAVLERKPQPCKACGKTFDRPSHLLVHMIDKHCENEEATQLDKANSDDSEYKLGKNKKHYFCNSCDKQFALKANLLIHKLTHKGKQTLTCDICQKDFALKSHLKAHIGVHSDRKRYSCGVCKRQFKQKNNYTRHVKTHEEKNRCACNFCGKKFLSWTHLATHKRTHTGERPHTCEICNKAFTDPSSLTKHSKIHTGERHSCDVCKKQFTQRASLAEHALTHKGEKPHSCDICKKQFTHRSSLRTHKRIHTGEKPYKCDICNKQFAHLSSLRTHKRSHEDEKPWSNEI